MQFLRSPHRWLVWTGLVLSLLAAAWVVRQAVEDERALFETDARIAHRLLSQATVQHDAILATLTLLQPTPDAIGAAPPEQRLPALHPHILAVQRRDGQQRWNEPALAVAEAASRQSNRAALAAVDFSAGRYQLVLAASPTSYALTIDLHAMVAQTDWPMDRGTSRVRVSLVHEGQRYLIQSGDPLTTASTRGWYMDFHKHLAAASQPFDMVAERRLGWAELPWWRMVAWVAGVCAMLVVGFQWRRQRLERRRAEELLRLGQVARLNTLGELAAGMAHELNQPLTAVLANTQAAQRLLKDDPPDLANAQGAMAQAAAQARRAADVVSRLRRVIERPGQGQATQSVPLKEAVQRVLYLLEPESQRRQVTPKLNVQASVTVLADPVALEQVIQNLLMNALQALEPVEPAARSLELRVSLDNGMGVLTVTDNGPGIAPETMAHLFEPFFSTREGGLGLGLNLCETLTHAMGGTLTAANAVGEGAVFTLTLPASPS